MAIELDALLKPIPGADPAGEDVSFDEVIDQMREARRSDDASLSQGDWQTDLKVADWRVVTDLATRVLTRKSKDLQSAVWLAEATISREGFAGAGDAFKLLSGLIDTYWDGLHPRLEGGDAEERASKLAWLNNYGGQALKKVPLTAAKPGVTLNDWATSRDVDNLARKDPAAHQAALSEGKMTGEAFDKLLVDAPADFVQQQMTALDAATAAFAAFKAVVDQRFGRAAPSLAELEDSLKRAQQVTAKAAKTKGLLGSGLGDEPSDAEAAAPAMAVGGAAFAAGVASGAMALNLSGNAQASKENALRVIAEIAQFFKRTEPHSPVSFLLQRAVTWANLPLDEFLNQVVRDDSVLAGIKDRTGMDR